jgi:preprotein translocase subunit SecD
MIKIRISIAFLLFYASLASGCGSPKFSTFISFAPDAARTVAPETLLQAQQVLQKILDAVLSGKSVVQVENNTLRVGLSDAKDLPTAILLATSLKPLTFFHSDMFIKSGEAMPANVTVILTGTDIAQASARQSPGLDQWEIEVMLNPQGKSKLAEYTRTHVGSFLVIAEDNRVISSPVIYEAITGGSMVINGIFDQSIAKILAALINSGALPVPLRVVN